MKRIIFLGICFFLTFASVQVAVNLLNKSVAAKDHFFVLKNSNKDSNFVINGILEWEETVQENRTPLKFRSSSTFTHLFDFFSTAYTTTNKAAFSSNWDYVLKRLFVLFENFRL